MNKQWARNVRSGRGGDDVGGSHRASDDRGAVGQSSRGGFLLFLNLAGIKPIGRVGSGVGRDEGGLLGLLIAADIGHVSDDGGDAEYGTDEHQQRRYESHDAAEYANGLEVGYHDADPSGIGELLLSAVVDDISLLGEQEDDAVNNDRGLNQEDQGLKQR